MKHLLIFSYYFPPHGGGGVLRPAEFARLLVREHGWKVSVVCGPAEDYWLLDPELRERLPVEVNQIRVGSLTGPGMLKRFARKSHSCHGRARVGTGRNELAIKFLRRVADWSGLPDVYFGWYKPAIKAAIEEAGDADCILSTSPPETVHLAAMSVARERGIPWIADLRDPWLNGIYRNYPTSFHRRWQENLERRVVGSANSVILNTEECYRDFLRRYKEQPRKKFVCLPNGFNPDEFTVPAEKKSGPFRLIHTGGMVFGRNPEILFQALHSLREDGFSHLDIQLEFVGVCNPAFRERAGKMGLAGMVNFDPVEPRSKVLERLSGCDAGLVVESFRKGAELVIPGKFYDYLGAGIPVIAISPDGALCRTIESLGCGFTVRNESPGVLAALLRELITRKQEKRPIVENYPDPNKMIHLNRHVQVHDLARLLSRLSSKKTSSGAESVD